MSSSALEIIGTVGGFMIGGPIGASIGGSLGRMADQSRADPLEGPRLGDLSISSSTYGSHIPIIYGDENRVSGNIIWSSGLKERRRKSGGKGGQETTEYSYSVDLAIALSQPGVAPESEYFLSFSLTANVELNILQWCFVKWDLSALEAFPLTELQSIPIPTEENPIPLVYPAFNLETNLVAVYNGETLEFSIYRFENENLTFLYSQVEVISEGVVGQFAFTPDGEYLLLSEGLAFPITEIFLYKIDEVSLVRVDTSSIPLENRIVSFSPDSAYLGAMTPVGFFQSPEEVILYKLEGDFVTGLTPEIMPNDLASPNMFWNPVKNYFSVTLTTGLFGPAAYPYLANYSVDETDLNREPDLSTPRLAATLPDWSPNGEIVAVYSYFRGLEYSDNYSLYDFNSLDNTWTARGSEQSFGYETSLFSNFLPFSNNVVLGLFTNDDITFDMNLYSIQGATLELVDSISSTVNPDTYGNFTYVQMPNKQFVLPSQMPTTLGPIQDVVQISESVLIPRSFSITDEFPNGLINLVGFYPNSEMSFSLFDTLEEDEPRACGGIKRIWANKKLIWEMDDSSIPPKYTQWSMTSPNDFPEGVLHGVAFYPGSLEQTPDPTIQAALGAEDTPAYIGTSYVVLSGLLLADFGNSVPTLEFEFMGVNTPTVGDCVVEICKRVQMSDDEYSVDAGLFEMPLRGYGIARASSAGAALDTMYSAFMFDAADHGGVTHFVPRGGDIVATIPEEQMGARAASDDPVEVIDMQRRPEHEMPAQAVLSYVDKDRDYQTGSQVAERFDTRAINKVSIQIPITLTAAEARRIVDRILWEPWASRVTAKFNLDLTWKNLEPTNIVCIPIAGQLVPVRIDKIEEGDNGVLSVTSVIDDIFVYEGSEAGEITFVPGQNVIISGETLIYLFDAPILLPTDSDTGFYFAISSPDEGWLGGSLLRSIDGGDSYTEVYRTATPNILGFVATPLGNGPVGIFDYINSFDVVMINDLDELESASELGVLNGRNAAWLGAGDGQQGELIQFTTVELLLNDPKTYRISGLLRGRRATEHFIGSHGPNEGFVLLESGLIHSADFGTADWNRVRHYKGVSSRQLETEVTDVTLFTNTGERAKPRSPDFNHAERDSSLNLLVSWNRRARQYTPGLGYGPVPLGEESERYEVDIMNGVTVVRTISVTTPEVVYTAAEQTSDGFVPGNPITMNVYQISASRGRGWPGEFTV